MDVLFNTEIKLVLTKREFTLITKALVGKLPTEEVAEAQNLGLALIDRARQRHEERAGDFDHAYRRAAGRV